MAQLRDAKRDACDGTVEALEKIVPAIRRRFGKRRIQIIVRAEEGDVGDVHLREAFFRKLLQVDADADDTLGGGACGVRDALDAAERQERLLTDGDIRVKAGFRIPGALAGYEEELPSARTPGEKGSF